MRAAQGSVAASLKSRFEGLHDGVRRMYRAGQDDGSHVHETLFVEGTIFAESAVNGSTETSAKDCGIDRASEMALVEEGCDLVTLLETCHARSNFLDNSGSIGSWDHTLFDGEGIFALTCKVRRENARSHDAGGPGAADEDLPWEWQDHESSMRQHGLQH